MTLLLHFLLGIFIGLVLYTLFGEAAIDPAFLLAVVVVITVCFILFHLGFPVADEGIAQMTELASELK